MRSAQLLVVDDEPQLLELLALTLHLAGFDVTSALSGLAALEHARRTTFDLILLDTWMAPWDGLETARQLRRLPDCPPIILLGEGRPGEAEGEGGPLTAPHLHKPFRTAQLIGLVEATLQLSRAASSTPPTFQPRS